MSTDVPPTHAPADWAEKLATIENELRPWIERAGEPHVEPDAAVASALPSEVFAERLERLQAYLDQAERNAEAALAPLTAEIEAFEQWLGTLNAARGKLVERTAGGV